MGVIIRQGFKATAVTYFGVALGALNLLFFFPKFLSAEEIGLREIIISVAMSLSIFTQLGLQSAMGRFFPYFKDESRQHNGYLLFCLGMAATGLLVFGGLFYLLRSYVMELFDANAALVNDFLWLVLPVTALMMVQTIFEIWARLHLRIVVNALIREVFLRLSLTLLTLLYAYQHISFEQFMLLFAATYLLAVLILMFYLRHLGVLFLQPKFVRIDPALRPELLRFSLWMMIGGAGVVINERIDGIMLAWLAGLSLAGIYSISFFIGTIIDMPRRAVGQIAGTLVAQQWKDRDFKAMGKLYKQASLNQLILGGLLFVLIWGNIDALFNLIPNGEVYRPGKWVVFFIGISRLIDMANGINSEIILNSPYYRFNLGSILFLGFISFGTNYIMIPIYGLVGAAAGSTLSVLLFNLLKGGFIYQKVGMQPFEKRTLQVILLLFTSYACGYFLPAAEAGFWSSVGSIALRSALMGSLLVLGVWKFRLSDELHALVSTQLGRFGKGNALK
ncbi:MAG: oligosaccharide flippase family protein [Sphingobacteriaceae bacterium]|nr:oligosaccharide flippase family protein [Sphingobacteriaceae bacterium]